MRQPLWPACALANLCLLTAGRAEHDPAAAELWVALRELQIVECEGTAIAPDGVELATDVILNRSCGEVLQVVSLPSDRRWMCADAQHMFVRKCWEELFGIVVQQMSRGVRGNGVVITGNPGIGKSWFLNYAMLRLARDAEHKHRAVVYESVAHGLIWTFERGGVVRKMDWRRRTSLKLLDESSTVYLFDPAGNTGETREPQRCDAFTVVTASPNPAHYKDFKKHSKVPGITPQTFYMAPWSLLELQAAAPYVGHTFGELEMSEVESRFERFGGVARVVLADSVEEHENDLEAAIHSCDVDEVLKAVNKADAANSVTHKILQYDVIDDSLRRVQARFASDYVARRCCDDMLRSQQDRMLRFLGDALSRPGLGNLPGTMFERWMHTLLVGGGKFNMRRLEPGAHGPGSARALGEGELTTVDVPVLEHHLFHTLSETQDMGGCHAYFEPDHSNFAVLDALIQCDGGCGPLSPHIGLQATTTLEHPIAMARLKEHLEHLGEPPSFDLVFVVPQNIFGEFRYQKYHTIGNRPATSIDKAMSKVKQWVLGLPVRDSCEGVVD